MDRRRFLMGSTVAGVGALGLAGCASVPGAPWSGVRTLDAEVEELQERTFRWFADTTNRANGLTPDRWPSKSFASIAAVGFALTCWPIGVERGWMSREEARERTLTTVRFFHDAPQGPEATGVSGHKGFFYHFLDMETGHRFSRTELSTVDTTLLLGGMLYAAQWFDGDHADEAEIRRLVKAVYERVEWDWAVVRPNRITMGWHPETGFIP
ncbi:MAG TPA: Tat pathway signal protein, partial [Phenylobacterium sp.]|nr:Tat pathway signal protein [Phenylobacterium sp.]